MVYPKVKFWYKYVITYFQSANQNKFKEMVFSGGKLIFYNFSCMYNNPAMKKITSI